MLISLNRIKPSLSHLIVLLVVGGCFLSSPSRADQQELEVALRQLERVTGLNFKRDVTLENQTREEFQEFLRGEMKKTFPGDDLNHIGRVYNFVGLLPMSYRLEERLPELYKDQVGAYYDPKRGKIFQVADDLPSASQFFLYLHEGVHALQDQHYDLGNKQARLARGTALDQQLAFSFMVEGHANLVATAAQMNATGLNEEFFNSKRFEYVFELQSRLTNLSPDQFKAITQLFGGGRTPSARSLSKLSDVPLILVQQMADPYLVGQNVLFQRARQRGFDRTLDLLRTIPGSTRALFFDQSHGQNDDQFDNPSGVYETTMGSYLIMRWLNIFDRRPAWVGQISHDRIALLGSESDRAVAWRFQFTSDKALVSFVNELNNFVVDNRPDSAGTDSVVFKRNNRSRYFWYKTSPSGLTLFFDDDNNVEPEITQHGYRPEQLSRGIPVSAVDS